MPRSSRVMHKLRAAHRAIEVAKVTLQDHFAERDGVLGGLGFAVADLYRSVNGVRDWAIRADLAAGLSGREVAARYGLTPGRISQIKRATESDLEADPDDQ